MLQRAATVRRSSVRGHESGRSSPSWEGVPPLSVMHPAFSPIASISASSSGAQHGSRGTPARSARLSSIGRAPSPGSWMSVGTTQATGAWASVHAHAS